MNKGLLRLGIPVLSLLLPALFVTEGQARREILPEAQKQKLKQAERVLLDVVAITEGGLVDAGKLTEVIARRMEGLGYAVVTSRKDPYDVVFKVKCEEVKTWEGTLSSGGDADLPDSPSRVWKGPACQFEYTVDGKSRGWRKEVRTKFQNAAQAAREAGVQDSGAFAMEALTQRLHEYDFPVKATAEWGQEGRLIALLKNDTLSETRKATVIQSLGHMFSTDAVPYIIPALKDPDLEVAKEAALALGNTGHKESIKALVEALKSDQPELQALAAKGLGKAGPLHADFSIIEPLLEALKTDNIQVKTEVVWALGKLPDRRAYEPLLALQQSLFNVNTSDRHSPEGKLWDAVNYSLKQINTFDMIN
ncbi:MAG: HEAT repeat domain-containing protein [Nitrospirales bacterium]